MNLLILLDLNPGKIEYLLHLNNLLKIDNSAEKETQFIKGKKIVLIFEKDSTRTRCAFETAAMDQGAHATPDHTSEKKINQGYCFSFV